MYECRVTTQDDIHTFEPLKQRTDKTQANSESVVKRTLRTIQDDITLSQLV